MPKMDWKQEVTWLTIIYRVLEKQEKIPLLTQGTPYEFIEKDLNEMHLAGLIEPDGEYWKPLAKAQESALMMLRILDQIYKFEIYGTVHVALKLPADIVDEQGNPLNHVFDPRFDATIPKSADLGTEDMRIAMLQFFREQFKAGDPISPERIIFMQMMAAGKIAGDDAFFNLKAGAIFSFIESIMLAHYKWTDTAPTPEEAVEVMKTIYMAGQIEQRKRNGDVCSKCSIPLAFFDEDGKLNACPNPSCGASFAEPKVRFKCPQCMKYLSAHKPNCKHCGARINFSLPQGTIEKETVATTTTITVWQNMYDYRPTPYYSIFNPFEDEETISVIYQETIW